MSEIAEVEKQMNSIELLKIAITHGIPALLLGKRHTAEDIKSKLDEMCQL